MHVPNDCRFRGRYDAANDGRHLNLPWVLDFIGLLLTVQIADLVTARTLMMEARQLRRQRNLGEVERNSLCV